MPSESDLIRIIADHDTTEREDVLTGIGDDGAVVRPRPGQDLVVTTDTLVEGVHFFPDADPGSLGHKALAVNLSDLAAMGAEPAWALLALTVPAADGDWTARFATGVSELGGRFGITVVGGDTTRGPLTITVQAIGFVPVGAALTRAGARAGDTLCVSGTLGDAALALDLQRRGAPVPDALRSRLDRPEPRVDLGRALRGRAHAAIDVSDGLLGDLARLLAASGAGATVEVDALPASPAFREAGGTREMQMSGGDDYELLFALPEQALSALAAFSVTRIGTVEAAPGMRCVDAAGRTVTPAATGFDHFGAC